MKRILIACAALLMSVALCGSVVFAAEADRFYLQELDADIALPSGEEYYCLYYDMPADSPALEYLELTAAEVNEILASSGALLDVLYHDISHEFIVYVSEDSISAELYHYGELSQLEQEIVLAASSAMLYGTDVVLLSSSWELIGDSAWMVLEYEVPGVVHCVRYNTVCNGKSLTIDATLYLSRDSSAASVEKIREVASVMAAGTVFHSIAETPEGVGGITGNLITDVLAETGMDTIDLTEMGLGTLNLTEMDLSGLDLDDLVDALGLTEEEAVSLVRGEMDPTELDLSKADPLAVMDALGMEQDAVVDVALGALGFGDLDWRGIMENAGRGAVIGIGAAAAVILIIIVLLAVCGSKKRGHRSAAEASAPEEEQA